MSHEFNGQQFTGAKAWALAYPAFGRHFWKYVVAGAKNATDIEVMARKSNAAGLKRASIAGRANKPRSVA